MKRLKGFLKTGLIWLAVGLFVVEEFIWIRGQRLVARVFAALHLTWFLSRISAANKWESIAWMLLPFIIVLPFKLAAVAFLSKGMPILSIITYIGAKITSTALIGRIYALAECKLRQFKLFDWLHIKVVHLNYVVKTWLHAQPAYITIKAIKERIRAILKPDPTSTVSRAKRLVKFVCFKRS